MSEETNPNGTRLDTMERMLRLMIEHHEAEFKAMRIWQVIAQDHMTRLEKLHEEQAQRLEQVNRQFIEAEDKRGQRIDNLVVAIGELVAQMKEQKR
jgi:hypothetical protein